MYFDPFPFWSKNKKESQIIQESKTFLFFLLIKVLLMLSYFLYNSIGVTWCIQKGEPSLHDLPDKQISGNVSATFQHFYFYQQSEKILQAYQILELFKFCCWLSITNAKLFFEAPMIEAWWLMIQSD